MKDSDDARRANQRKNRNANACPICYGDVWGLPSGYLPHAPSCADVEQDREMESLSDAPPLRRNEAS